ncbi:unnamed protein product [Musa acuminata subsp. malaccensis]|uniref:(wild Malaysian banana) hypothetical protein n=1 Tax=Musa acuminata subsp. malaccensis TaxID=214687 RepID=A0A804KKS4_MUSAM|nr:PREDICTED: MLP-like protein 423 [Musa acuminata subsp. malaccensis]CAG1835519.1 unnamed protein product [Musa acuminata subsp. malaccensis]
MASMVEVGVEVKSSPDKFWTAIHASTKLIPRILPPHHKSIRIIEGDGNSVGTIRLLKYAQGVPLITFAKQAAEELDDADITDSEIVSFYKTFKTTLKVEARGDSSLVKYYIEYEKVYEEVPDPHLTQEMAVKHYNELFDLS